jgi:phosphoglycolate phosphatase
MLFIDLDGTILDDARRHYATYTEVLSGPDMRGLPLPEREFWSLWREAKPFEELLRASRLFPTKFKAFTELFEARLESPEMLALDTIRAGTETALGKLYTKTPIILIAERKDRINLDNQLVSLKIAKYFAQVLSGVPKKVRRVDKDAQWKHKAKLVRDRYKILPTEALYIGDSDVDVKVARDLKFDVYLVENGHRTRELMIKADPDRIVPDLTGGLKFMLPGGRWQR